MISGVVAIDINKKTKRGITNQNKANQTKFATENPVDALHIKTKKTKLYWSWETKIR